MCICAFVHATQRSGTNANARLLLTHAPLPLTHAPLPIAHARAVCYVNCETMALTCRISLRLSCPTTSQFLPLLLFSYRLFSPHEELQPLTVKCLLQFLVMYDTNGKIIDCQSPREAEAFIIIYVPTSKTMKILFTQIPHRINTHKRLTILFKIYTK